MIPDGMAGHGSHQPGKVCLECERLNRHPFTPTGNGLGPLLGGLCRWCRRTVDDPGHYPAPRTVDEIVGRRP